MTRSIEIETSSGKIYLPADQDPVLKSFVDAGLVRTTSKEEPRMTELETIQKYFIRLAEKLDQQFSAVYQRLDAIEKKLASAPSGGGAPRRGGAKKALSNIVTVQHTIQKVFKDPGGNGGMRYTIITEGGPKMSSWKADIGEVAYSLEGQEALITYGTNDRGYIDFTAIEPVAGGSDAYYDDDSDEEYAADPNFGF